MKHAVITLIGIVALTLLATQTVFSNDDIERKPYKSMKNTVASDMRNNADKNVYQKECGSCHFAYPPGLLPQRSWQKIMDTLHDHFGDNAELSADTHQAVYKFLMANSAEQSPVQHSKKFIKSLNSAEVPLRITQLPYFKHEHREIPKRMVSDNPKVNSLSQCDRCHQDAESGAFRESRINIPGFGRWDD
jgi:cytochrome c5